MTFTESGAAGGRERGGLAGDDPVARTAGGGCTLSNDRPSLSPLHPTSWGSQQWRLMRRALRDGATIEQAAQAGSMTVDEARGLAKLDADRAPLPPEAFDPIYDPAARAAQQAKDSEMADDYDDEDEVTEVKQMDFAGAKRIYLADIAPEKTQAASHQQAVGEAYKIIKKNYGIQPQSAKAAIKWFEMEEAHGEDFLRGLAGLVNELANRTVLTFHGNDLVDRAEGLVTLDDVPADQPFEASDAELAQQEGRGTKRKGSAKAETTAALH